MNRIYRVKNLSPTSLEEVASPSCECHLMPSINEASEAQMYDCAGLIAGGVFVDNAAKAYIIGLNKIISSFVFATNCL